MTVRYGKFELPTKIQADESKKTNRFVRFVAEPFERGFGHTIGNAMRRIMLTSLEAPAIISVKIEGVPHEYTAVPGVIEDVTHIILNLKGALLRRLPLVENKDSRASTVLSKVLDVTQEMIDAGEGQYVVTLQDIVDSPLFEVVNPDHVICTVTQPVRKQFDLKVAIGRGYVPAERHGITDAVVDEIVMDSSFSPVMLVNYFVENTRVGQDTDFDRLILEVTTDGRVTPQEVLAFATQIAIHHFKIFGELKLQNVSFEKEESEYDTDREELLSKLVLRIDEIELSVRSMNCLRQAAIDTIAELVVIAESEMLQFRNFGKKSLNEIKEKLEEMHLHLGIDLSRFGIDRTNVKEVIEAYLREKEGKEGAELQQLQPKERG
ncbi:MAG: DNA-directed RNA polymerase subunit alpha [Simkaniaceae bacterium]|nr:DNA-directed RNA polymerase subunit alpha [Simkaniaceae bacterium]